MLTLVASSTTLMFATVMTHPVMEDLKLSNEVQEQEEVVIASTR